MNHPWHDVAVHEPLEDGFPAVIETPADSPVQYDIELATGFLRATRILSGAMHYPANYGLIPRTLAADGAAVDIVVIGQEAVAPVTILRVRAIGLLRYERAGRSDDKVIAVHADDPVFASVSHLEQIPSHWRAMLTRFFDDYRALDGKKAAVLGFEGPTEALAFIRERRATYDTTCTRRPLTS